MTIEQLQINLIEIYLSYRNDFLTVEGFADYHHLSDENARQIIDLGRPLFNEYYVDNDKLVLRPVKG